MSPSSCARTRTPANEPEHAYTKHTRRAILNSKSVSYACLNGYSFFSFCRDNAHVKQGTSIVTRESPNSRELSPITKNKHARQTVNTRPWATKRQRARSRCASLIPLRSSVWWPSLSHAPSTLKFSVAFRLERESELEARGISLTPRQSSRRPSALCPTITPTPLQTCARRPSSVSNERGRTRSTIRKCRVGKPSRRRCRSPRASADRR